MNTCQKSKFVDAKNVDCLIHFIIYFQIFNQNFIWSWMIYIACSLKIRIHLICNHVKSNRCFRIFSTHAISNTFSQFWNLIQIRITSCLNATISSVCKTIEFEIFKIYTCSRKSFAQILDHNSFTFYTLRFVIER